tara:strand:- start:3308 stop:3427 length:120 start_codon:yes stop_codon:yes gene_type:complete
MTTDADYELIGDLVGDPEGPDWWLIALVTLSLMLIVLLA